MSTLRVLVLVATALVLGQVCAQLDDQQEQQDLKPARSGRFLSSAVKRVFSGPSQCGHPDSCPSHHCRLDDAVVHGFCCGCARHSDRVPIECPPWLKCPLLPVPLCDDYNWMMDCCC